MGRGVWGAELPASTGGPHPSSTWMGRSRVNEDSMFSAATRRQSQSRISELCRLGHRIARCFYRIQEQLGNHTALKCFPGSQQKSNTLNGKLASAPGAQITVGIGPQ